MIKTLLAKKVYENEYVRVYDDDVEFRNGTTGTYYYSRWKAPHGVAILPFAQGAVLLVRNYRYADKCYSLEIPQGFGRENATPVEDARRELAEETGLIAKSFQFLFCVGRNFRTHVFLASMDDFLSASSSQAEESEDITGFEILNLNEVSLDLIERAGIFDAITIAALFAASRAFLD